MCSGYAGSALPPNGWIGTNPCDMRKTIDLLRFRLLFCLPCFFCDMSEIKLRAERGHSNWGRRINPIDQICPMITLLALATALALSRGQVLGHHRGREAVSEAASPRRSRRRSLRRHGAITSTSTGTTTDIGTITS